MSAKNDVNSCIDIIDNMNEQCKNLLKIVNTGMSTKLTIKTDIEKRFENNKKLLQKVTGVLDNVSDLLDVLFGHTTADYESHKQLEGETELIGNADDNKISKHKNEVVEKEEPAKAAEPVKEEAQEVKKIVKVPKKKAKKPAAE
jgi:hypothetical protein